MRRFATLCFSLLIVFVSYVAQADQAFVQRHDVQNFINKLIKRHGFQKAELIRVMNDVQLQPQVIESMNKPFEKKNWDVYKQLFLTPERVQAGMEFWRSNSQVLEKAEKATRCRQISSWLSLELKRFMESIRATIVFWMP